MRELPDDALLEHYRESLARYGPGHLAVQWTSIDAQQRRFAVLSAVVDSDDCVIDVGCGLGDLLDFLRTRHGFRGRYLGLDLLPEFVALAERRYAADDRAEFCVFDARRDPYPAGYDCILVSGMFNNRVSGTENNTAWIQRSVSAMYAASRRAVAFNSLSAHNSVHAPDLFYTDPAEMLGWCARHLTPDLALRQDYSPPPASGVPIDYTVYLYRNS